MTRPIVALMAGLVIAACSDSSSPNTTNIAGTWTLSATGLTGGGLTCTLTGAVRFVQNGQALSGDLPGDGVITQCTGNGGGAMAQSAGTNLVTGSVNGHGVTFGLDAQSVVATGSVTGTGMMSGSDMTVSYPADGIDVTGAWTATEN
jgi:hypothetical protein